MINIKETIQLIKTDEKFRQVFHFETDSKKISIICFQTKNCENNFLLLTGFT